MSFFRPVTFTFTIGDKVTVVTTPPGWRLIPGAIAARVRNRIHRRRNQEQFLADATAQIPLMRERFRQ